MVAQVDGPVLLVGHSYGGAVITGAGNAPNVVGLVYVAAFAPDEGEALGEIAQAAPPPAGAAKVAPDSDGYVWINPAAYIMPSPARGEGKGICGSHGVTLTHA
jgi:pimeloyl-ACP methyl ester carboxylesterase